MSEHAGGTPVQLNLPEFAIEAIDALLTHEDVHAQGDQCYASTVAAFPPEVRAFISGYHAGRTRSSRIEL